MGPMSAVLTGILLAVIITAVWLTLNQHQLQTAAARMRDAVQRLLTRHLGDLGQRGIRWATRLFDGAALAVLTIGLITLCVLEGLFYLPGWLESRAASTKSAKAPTGGRVHGWR
jgi:hypothetical protein